MSFSPYFGVNILSWEHLMLSDTVFTQKTGAALIKFFKLLLRRLFEGGAYSRAPLI